MTVAATILSIIYSASLYAVCDFLSFVACYRSQSAVRSLPMQVGSVPFLPDAVKHLR
jgi:hypothetical protein